MCSLCAIYALTFNLSVDKQHDNRANNGNHEAAKIEAIDFTKAKQRADPSADYGTDYPQQDSHKESTTIFTWHDLLRQNTGNKPKNNP